MEAATAPNRRRKRRGSGWTAAPKKHTPVTGPGPGRPRLERPLVRATKLYPSKPDLTIFSDDVQLHDPSGKRLQGLGKYEKGFDMLRLLRRTTMQDAEITYRLVTHDDEIRVRWSAKMYLRDPAFGLTTLNIIDGVFDKAISGHRRLPELTQLWVNGPELPGAASDPASSCPQLVATRIGQPLRLVLLDPSFAFFGGACRSRHFPSGTSKLP